MGAFLLWAHRGDLNLRRSERKENASVFSELARTPAGCNYGSNADISYVRNPSGQKTSNMSTVTRTVAFLKLIILKFTQQMYVNLTLV